MASLAGRVPLDAINTRAREVEFGRVLLTVLAGVLFGLGWLVGKTVKLVWLAVAWSFVAVKVGFEQGRTGGARGPA